MYMRHQNVFRAADILKVQENFQNFWESPVIEFIFS